MDLQYVNMDLPHVNNQLQNTLLCVYAYSILLDTELFLLNKK